MERITKLARFENAPLAIEIPGRLQSRLNARRYGKADRAWQCNSYRMSRRQTAGLTPTTAEKTRVK